MAAWWELISRLRCLQQVTKPGVVNNRIMPWILSHKNCYRFDYSLPFLRIVWQSLQHGISSWCSRSAVSLAAANIDGSLSGSKLAWCLWSEQRESLVVKLSPGSKCIISIITVRANINAVAVMILILLELDKKNSMFAIVVVVNIQLVTASPFFVWERTVI